MDPVTPRDLHKGYVVTNIQVDALIHEHLKCHLGTPGPKGH